MTVLTDPQTRDAWMTRIGWVLTVLTAANMISDSFGKFAPPALLLEDVHRLGESEGTLYLVGILQLTVGVLYLIPRTAIRCHLDDWFLGRCRGDSDTGEWQRSLSDHASRAAGGDRMGWNLLAGREATEAHCAAGSAGEAGRESHAVSLIAPTTLTPSLGVVLTARMP